MEWFLHNQAQINNKEIMAHQEIMVHKDNSKEDTALAINKEVIVNKASNIMDGINLKEIGDQDNKVLGALNNLLNPKERLQKNLLDQKSQQNYPLQQIFNVLNLINLKK